MKIRIVIAFIACFLGSLVAAQDEPLGVQIRLVDPLDEPEFYCVDLAGWGANLQIDDPLQTHTCKLRGATDQMFAFVEGRMEVIGYDRCLQAGGSSGVTLPGSAVLARDCSDSPLQQISLSEQGKLTIGEYCLGSGSESKEASGPSHVWRTLTVVECDTDTSLTTWQVGLE